MNRISIENDKSAGNIYYDTRFSGIFLLTILFVSDILHECEVYISNYLSAFFPLLYYTLRYLFLDHVRTVGLHVAKAGKIPIIWDDMLRNKPHTDIKEWFYK